jgi:putative resolvase
MKTKEVLQLLRIHRSTLCNYVKDGLIKTLTLPNGRYDYDKQDVEKLLNGGIPREVVIYARVSTVKQKQDLVNQIELCKQFCFSNGIQLNAVYKDIASGISFNNRKEFFILLDKILTGKVKKVIITYKDRLSRVGFDLFRYLFEKNGTEITVISEVGSEKLDSQEIFEEIVSLLHCYSMKLYSKRKNAVIKQLCKE